MSESAFSPDYTTARLRFREATSALGWRCESHPAGGSGPDGEPLTIDVGLSPDNGREVALVLSSGLHGIEGFFGSAVQLALLRQWQRQGPPPVRCVMIHALNPYGFAWLRRFDEQNVDPNRNFLLPGELYRGAPAAYAQLDSLLNPPRPPRRLDGFLPKALWKIARHGMAPLRQAIATGQYEYPQGLFFGGSGPSSTHRVLDERMQDWLKTTRRAVHLDLHTGLGAWGRPKLLVEASLSEQHRHWLTEQFGDDAFETGDSSTTAYKVRGGFGRWCHARQWIPNYLYACAEFGTYGPLRVLTGLRAENQAHHWTSPESGSRSRAKRRLKELFCPAARSWRNQVMQQGLELVERAVKGLGRLDEQQR